MNKKQTVQEWLDASEDNAIVVYDKAGNPAAVKIREDDKRSLEEIKQDESRRN